MGVQRPKSVNEIAREREEQRPHMDSLAFLLEQGIIDPIEYTETAPNPDDLVSLSDGRYWQGWNDGLQWSYQTLKGAAHRIRSENPLMADFWEQTAEELKATAERFKESQGCPS